MDTGGIPSRAQGATQERLPRSTRGFNNIRTIFQWMLCVISQGFPGVLIMIGCTALKQPAKKQIMHKTNLACKIKLKFKATTHSNHDLPVAENLLDHQFKVDKAN